jgi:hypothetical protein
VTATAVITAIAPTAQLVDKTGAITAVTPQADSAYHLPLEPSSNNSDPRDRSLYLTGGSPLILVEQIPAAASTPTSSPTVTPKPTPSATATVRPTATPLPIRKAFPPARPIAAPAASAHVRFFAATRHSLGGPFLSFYVQHGGMEIVGRPLTEPWRAKGVSYQLFEHVLLRCVGCSRTGAGRVSIAPLGLLVTRGRRFPATALAVTTDITYRYFPTTHHSLQGALARFWTTHGDQIVLGLPISEPLSERVAGARQQVLVQYLQNVRLELWPDGRGRFTVRVGRLGADYLNLLLTGRADWRSA